jgi:hypothetical protein
MATDWTLVVRKKLATVMATNWTLAVRQRLPEYLEMYRLIWREHYREVRTTIASGGEQAAHIPAP